MLPVLKRFIEEGKALRPEQVADALNVKLQTVYSWKRRGILPYFQLEKCVRFDPATVAEFWRQRQVTS